MYINRARWNLVWRTGLWMSPVWVMLIWIAIKSMPGDQAKPGAQMGRGTASVSSQRGN